MPPPELIAICIPTCLRPQMLGECLRSLAKTRIPAGCEVSLIVLDNDANQSARQVVAAAKFPFAARYVCEARRGLSSVRNRALAEATSAKADYLAFIDDDIIVNENWLSALAEGLQQTGADGIGGCVEYIYPDNKPPWWMRPPKTAPDENAKTTKAGFSTNLLLMKARVFADMRFDESFNTTGAEDYDFSRRAMLAGFVCATTGKAKATEKTHPARLTLANHCKTQWQRQTGYVLSHRKTDGKINATIRFLPRGIVKTIKGIIYCTLAPILGKKALQKGIKNLIAGTGTIYGTITHGNYQKYAKIDGE
ncbi:MAG: glycosyltransferase family 2 protein [Gammaproteobacteria bacterium]